MRLPRSIPVVVLAAVLASPGLAQDDADDQSRGVARLSLINGDVSVRRGDSGDWVAAAINAPLVAHDRVFTGPNSRGEVQFDWANMIRLASHSEIRLSELAYRRYQIQIARGTVTFRVLRDSEADVELSTPAVSVRPTRKGTYRIEVREDGRTEITVRSGEAEVFTPKGVERLKAGRTMMVRGTASDPEFQIVAEVHEDGWDRWNYNRDRDLERTAGYRYVHRDVYGVEDLDHYGSWIYAAPYGYVWSPRVVVGWAPYRYGRWAWIDWYGWSWVSYDPWGWAPYHYGRWFWYRNAWCWWPGGFYGRHYWSPGLVGWFGWGRYSGFHIGFGFGSVGWVPLAPYEPFHRWWGRGYYGGYRNRTFIDNSINITNNVNITNVYRNARIQNAVTGLDTGDFTRGRSGNALRVTDGEFQRASLVRGALPVTPERESLRLADREVRRDVLPRGSEEGRFFSRRQAAAVERVPFDEQRRGMEQISRRAFENQRAEGVTRPVEGARGGEAVRSAERVDRSDTAERGWRRAGEPARQESTRPVERVERSERSADAERGWRRFGEPGASREVLGDRKAREATREEGSRGSRRFGEPVQRESRTEPGRVQRESNENWRRFEGRRESAPDPVVRDRGDVGRSESAPRVERPRDMDRGGRTERFEMPRRESPSFERPRGGDMRGGESIRINPPIVRERSSPRWEGGGSRSSGGFEGRAPRGSDGGGGRMSAPAPRSDGGGGARSGGGGGGGSSRGGGESRGGGRSR